MSHFTVTVAVAGSVPKEALHAAVGAALVRYDENRVVKPRVLMSKSEIAADERFQSWWSAREPEGAGSLKSPPLLSYDQAVSEWYGGEVNSAGDLLTTYNPDSKWDWWVVGGRWAGGWTLKPGAESAMPSEASAFGMTDESADPRTDAARKCEIEPESIAPAFAYVDLDGEWHEQARMGWWGQTTDETPETDWVSEYGKWLLSLPDDAWVVRVDAHI